MRLLTIIQSPSQLKAEPRKGYGRDGAATLITNHALQILYTPRKQSDANEYSEMLGYYSFKAKSVSRQRGGKNSGGRSESESDQKRALMLPQELKEMSQREQIITLENTKAIRCEKILYFGDHVFIDRLKSVSPTLRALDDTPRHRLWRRLGLNLRTLPSKQMLEDTWGRGELAVDVPRLDLDLHDAMVQRRIRPLSAADVEAGVDLDRLALDASALRRPPASAESLAPQDIENFVNDFFDALDALDAQAPAVADKRPSAPPRRQARRRQPAAPAAMPLPSEEDHTVDAGEGPEDGGMVMLDLSVLDSA